MLYHISKTYTESVSQNYNSQKFTTTLSKDIDVLSAEELVRESAKLFEQCKRLTENDIKKYLKT